MSWVTDRIRDARRLARRTVNGVLRFADAASHPGRRSRVVEQLERAGRPRRVMVVCYGNICRSPYLAARLRHALPGVDVVSAGFVGAGRPVPAHAATLAARDGLDLSGHRSQLIPRDVLAASDLIIVMSESQARSLRQGFGVPRERIVIAGDLDPVRHERREIHDPWNQPIEVFEATFARLARCATELSAIMRRVP